MTETKALTGVQKAAVVLMQLSQARAAEVLRHLGEAEAEDVAAEIVRMRHVDDVQAEAALREFHERASNGRRGARGGRDFAAELLEASFGADRATGLLERLAPAVGGKAFEFLDAADATQVANLLDGELPETVALVLAHLGAQQASAVVGHLGPETKVDIAQAIATMGTAAVGYESGSHENTGNTAALTPKTTRKSRASDSRTASGSPPIFTERSAMLTVPSDA